MARSSKKLNFAQLDELRTYYEQALDSTEFKGRHAFLMEVLAQLGIHLTNRDAAMKVAEWIIVHEGHIPDENDLRGMDDDSDYYGDIADSADG